MTSAFAEIIRAITPFGIPHAPGKYEGEETEKWITYNYADDRGNAFADDEPGDRLVSMQLHLFLPERENFISLRREIREAIFSTGEFTFPAFTDLGPDATGKRHLVFEFDGIEERENGI